LSDLSLRKTKRIYREFEICPACIKPIKTSSFFNHFESCSSDTLDKYLLSVKRNATRVLANQQKWSKHKIIINKFLTKLLICFLTSSHLLTIKLSIKNFLNSFLNQQFEQIYNNLTKQIYNNLTKQIYNLSKLLTKQIYNNSISHLIISILKRILALLLQVSPQKTKFYQAHQLQKEIIIY